MCCTRAKTKGKLLQKTWSVHGLKQNLIDVVDVITFALSPALVLQIWYDDDAFYHQTPTIPPPGTYLCPSMGWCHHKMDSAYPHHSLFRCEDLRPLDSVGSFHLVSPDGKSIDGGTPKSSSWIGFSLINHPAAGVPPPFMEWMVYNGKNTIPGWWFGCHVLFSHILGC